MEAKEELNKKPKADESDALESVIMHVGQMGLYQKLLFAMMAPFGVFFAFVYFVQMFITATPQMHWCKVPELAHLDAEIRRNLTTPFTNEWQKCMMYDANWTEVLLNMTAPTTADIIPCKDGLEFQLGDIPYHTVVSERGWVCEKSGYAPTAQAAFFAGSIVGGVLFGWMADFYGRVPALVGANFVAFIGSVATIYTRSLWDFVISRFIVGMAYDTIFMAIYILVLEYVGPKHRTWVANISIAIFFGGGCVMLPWIALAVGDWRKLLWYTSLPFLISILVPFVVPESARWLASRGHVNQAVKVLKRFEKVNGTKIPQDVLDEFIVSATQTRRNEQESIKSVFRSGPLRKMMLLMVTCYMAVAIIFDGLVRMSEGLGLDFFITFTLTSATEIPSVTLLALVLDKWGRRNLVCGPLITSGALCLIAAFVPKGVPQVTLAIMARFMINMGYNAAMQWCTELLPTAVRASGSSLVHVSGYVATVISPFVVYSERIWRSLPLLILGVIAITAAGFGLMLPETKGRPMPQTIEEGERIVRSYTLCGSTPQEVPEADISDKEKALDT